MKMLREPKDGKMDLVICNDTPNESNVNFVLRNVETGKTVLEGKCISTPDSVITAGQVNHDPNDKIIYSIEWNDSLGNASNHYLCGKPPFNLEWYKSCLSHYL